MTTEPPQQEFIHGFDLSDLLISATRCYTGRMTIQTCAFAENLAKAWPDLPDHAQEIIRRDLESAFRLDGEYRANRSTYLGMDCDRAAWEKVRAAYQAHERTENE